MGLWQLEQMEGVVWSGQTGQRKRELLLCGFGHSRLLLRRPAGTPCAVEGLDVLIFVANTERVALALRGARLCKRGLNAAE